MKIVPVKQSYNQVNINPIGFNKNGPTHLQPMAVDSVSFGASVSGQGVEDLFSEINQKIKGMNETYDVLSLYEANIDNMVCEMDGKDSWNILLYQDIFKAQPKITDVKNKIYDGLIIATRLANSLKDNIEDIQNNPDAMDVYLKYNDIISDLPIAKSEIKRAEAKILNGQDPEAAFSEAKVNISKHAGVQSLLDSMWHSIYNLPNNKIKVERLNKMISQIVESGALAINDCQNVLNKIEKNKSETDTSGNPFFLALQNRIY